MHVGRADEGEAATAQLERGALLDHELTLRIVSAEVGNHHLERRRRGNDGRLGVALHENGDARRVVGLHVMNDEVIRRATRKRGVEVRQPLVSEVNVDGIRYGDLLVAKDDVGVIGHAIGAHVVLALE